MNDNDQQTIEQNDLNYDSNGSFKDFAWVLDKIDLLDNKMNKIIETLEVITNGARK